MLCIPMDHGVTNGPISGLENPQQTISAIARGGASAFLVHKGILKALTQVPSIGAIVHLNASTVLGPSKDGKVLVTAVAEAVRLGADAVSIHINVGSDEEPVMLRDLGAVADECEEWGVPLLAMMYPRGPRIKEADAVTVSHVARVGAELGADVVKTVMTAKPEDFAAVVESCPVPVVVAGGAPAGNDLAVLRLAETAIKAGAMGITFGRNVFGHAQPEKITRALSQVVFKGLSPETAAKELD